MTLKIKGELEIDRERGVIYFHSNQGHTALRICNLPTPVPTTDFDSGMDITFGVGCSWKGKAGRLKLEQPVSTGEQFYGVMPKNDFDSPVPDHFQSDEPPDGDPDSAFADTGNLKHFQD